MVNISAITFQNHLFDYLETVQQETVVLEQLGKPIAVLVSYQTYQQLLKQPLEYDEEVANCLHTLDQAPSVIPPSQQVEEIMAWLNKTD
jgi:prevent-host-death family protein